ncbi:F-box domain-containing protein [Strongyloides ratti]|uniref:F-box domain-containing protein n=1 Tax=Strongyloides ratti TaxID=34506 RepID=A0A090LB77_STRRB|nr:F-box domain-containing protein [Strongyloides ratti]CEF64745.1 F-box domain-containing protein [Strongyloides ratti]
MNFDLQMHPLPNEILIVIFSKLDWKTIQSLRKTCKTFYTIIEGNLKYIEKPKINDLYIYEFIDSNDMKKMHANFSFIKQDFLNGNEEKKIGRCNLTDTSMNNLEYFIKRLNLKTFGNITITVQSDTKFFEIFNIYSNSEVSIKHLCMSVNNLEDSLNFIEFMKKLKNVEVIELINVCLAKDCIPLDFNLPTVNNLLYFSVKECKCTSFVNKNMIKKLLYGNPNMYKISLDSTRPNCDVEIIDAIKEKQYLNQDNEYLEEKFYKYFDSSSYKLHKIGILPERVVYIDAILPSHDYNIAQQISITFEHRIFSKNQECKSLKNSSLT